MNSTSLVTIFAWTALIVTPLAAQVRPDFSGVWRLDAVESQRIGDGADSANVNVVTWLIDHRDPEINVVVDVRDSEGSHEFSFRCTTNGQECVNELPSLRELRRMSAVWKDDVLVMSQRASTPHGDFEARDRLTMADAGQQLIFERIVTNELGDRSVRQVFRKLGPHPSRRPPPEPLPTIDLPPELDRVLREYEQHWHAGSAEALVALFTQDGMVARRGGWIRGQAGLREALQSTSSELRLRAVEYAVDERVGYIVGAYGYGSEPSIPDSGMFILTLRRDADGQWLIAADLDGAIRP